MIHRRCLLLYVILRYKSKYKKVGVLPIRIVWPNVSSIDPSSERNSTKTFLYFDLYLYSAYAAHYVYIEIHLYTSRYLYTARFIDYTSLQITPVVQKAFSLIQMQLIMNMQAKLFEVQILNLSNRCQNKLISLYGIRKLYWEIRSAQPL